MTQPIDAKSTLMAFILLEALKGQQMELTARGADSALAVHALSALFPGTYKIL